MNPTLQAGGAKREQAIASFAFFLLFPGFFFYHTLLGIGAMGAYLGGYFSPVSLMVVLPLVHLYLYRVRRDPNRLNKVDVAFMLFLAYFAAIVAANAALGDRMIIVIHHLEAILFLVNVFIMFKTIDFSHRNFRGMALLSLLAMSAIVFSFSVDGVFYLGALGIAKDAGALATYQGFSRSYLITFIAVIAFTRPAWMRVLLYSLAAPTLFFNTARSEFVALLFLIPIIELHQSNKKLVLILVLGTVVMLINMNLDQLIQMLPNNRILELFDLSQSTSANKRHHLSVLAQQTILAHPFLGDYGSYPAGLYAHNILSAWVDLGMLGISYLMLLLACPAIPMFFKDYFALKENGNFMLGFVLACVTVLLLLTSHYFTDMLIGATLGSYSTYWYGRKYDKFRSAPCAAPAVRYPHLRQASPQPYHAPP